MNATERFGNYVLLKKIGRGGMAELFLARQVGVAGFERVLAIKRILPHLTEDPEFVEMFVNEAKIAAQITHPNVVQIYDFGTVMGTYYIAMEYVMGKSLAAVLTTGKERGQWIPPHHAVQITARIASGLDHAHRGQTMSGEPLGIIHRDISPQNILLGYNGDIKLVDFGIAKAASSSTHTQTGMIKGKLAYLSPEQAWGKPVDHRADVFSLGIVLHEMLTGQRLFKAENEIATLERVRTAKVPPPSSLNPLVAKDLDPIVLKALTQHPDDRYPTAQAFQDALDKHLLTLGPLPTGRDLATYLHGLFEKDLQADNTDFKQATSITPRGATATTALPKAKTPTPQFRPSPPLPPPSQRRGRIVAVGLAGALLAVAAGAGAWWFTQGRTEPSAPQTVSVEPAAAAIPIPDPTPVAEPSRDGGTDSAPEPPITRSEPVRARTVKRTSPAPIPRDVQPARRAASRVTRADSAPAAIKAAPSVAPVSDRSRPATEGKPLTPPPPAVTVQAPAPVPVRPQFPSVPPPTRSAPIERDDAPLPFLP
ncbi:MAG: protein kinase [Nitrospirae bacterium]|nr:protein kinase [Nitrospirota bacterium]